MAKRLLTLNSGSSSLKWALFTLTNGSPAVETKGKYERLSMHSGGHDQALEHLFEQLEEDGVLPDLVGVGHRVAHGGARLRAPVRVTPEVVREIEALVPFAPNHLPAELAGIRAIDWRAAESGLSGLIQVACFDTAFHRTLPPVARRLPLPRRFYDAGVVRYGFHGLSYQSGLDALRSLAPERAGGRLVMAHLGNGSSLAAVRAGECVDTTMSFTPLGGLMMGTRCGDLDPGVVLYLLEKEKATPSEMAGVLGTRAGLLGVSGISPDVRDLSARRASEPAAAEALDLYCYLVAKHAAAMAVAAGGLDTLVFLGGIGENSAGVREAVIERLAFLGCRLDAEANGRNAPVISAPDSGVEIRVIASDEEMAIARETASLVAGGPGTWPDY